MKRHCRRRCFVFPRVQHRCAFIFGSLLFCPCSRFRMENATLHVENEKNLNDSDAGHTGMSLCCGWTERPRQAVSVQKTPHRLKNVNHLLLLYKGEIYFSPAQRPSGLVWKSDCQMCYKIVLIDPTQIQTI